MTTPLPGVVPWPEDLAHRWRERGYWTGETFTSLLAERVRLHPSRVALVDGDRRITYADLQRRASDLAAGLDALGVGARDRVVVQLGNTIEFFEVCFALFDIGALPVFALPAHRSAEIGYFIEHTNAVAYVVATRTADGADLRPLAMSMIGRTDGPRHVVVVGDTADPSADDGLVDLNSLRHKGDRPAPAAVPQPSDVAFLQLSGGSTGLPKLIPRTHDEYLYTLRESATICELDEATRYLAVLPVAHNFTMSSPGCFGVFCVGGQVVLAQSGDPDTAFALIERERITITAVVPPLGLVWIDAADRGARGRDLSSLQVIQIGGAPLAEGVARRVRPALGAQLQQVFGMAEGLVNYTRLDDPDELVVTTQGRPISPDDELLIVDDHDVPVAAGETGHLLTRGPYTIRGYYRAEEHNASAFTADGFYRTGDVVRLTPQGYLQVVGRAKDQINRGGEKIAAEELEAHLLAHDGIHDAAVVAMPDAVLGERLCAFVIPAGSSRGAEAGGVAGGEGNGSSATHGAGATERLTRRDIATFLTGRGVAAYKIPDRVVTVSAFPETGVGKTSKRELRAALREQLR